MPGLLRSYTRKLQLIVILLFLSVFSVPSVVKSCGFQVFKQIAVIHSHPRFVGTQIALRCYNTTRRGRIPTPRAAALSDTSLSFSGADNIPPNVFFAPSCRLAVFPDFLLTPDVLLDVDSRTVIATLTDNRPPDICLASGLLSLGVCRPSQYRGKAK